MPTTDSKIDIDSVQGTAVLLLDSQGQSEAAELLEIGQLRYRMVAGMGDLFSSLFGPLPGRSLPVQPPKPSPPQVEPVLFVDAHLLDHYSEAVLDLMGNAIAAVLRMDGYRVTKTTVAPKKVEGDWRSARQQERLAGISNQSHRQPLDKPHPVKDGLHFRDHAEVLVYDALVALADSRPKSDTISITVNAPVRVSGHTFIPDFIVTFRHRAGIIEVDGATHHKRYLSDSSKNELFIDAGFLVVYRIPAEETDRPEIVKSHLDTFMRRLLAR